MKIVSLGFELGLLSLASVPRVQVVHQHQFRVVFRIQDYFLLDFYCWVQPRLLTVDPRANDPSRGIAGMPSAACNLFGKDLQQPGSVDFDKSFADVESNFLPVDSWYWEYLFDLSGSLVSKDTDAMYTIKYFVFLFACHFHKCPVFFSQCRVDHLNSSEESNLVPSFLELGFSARLGHLTSGKDSVQERNQGKLVDSKICKVATFAKCFEKEVGC